jgi:putrescine importer
MISKGKIVGQKTTLKRSLGMWPMVMLGLGYLTPAVVFDTFGMASRDTQGHVPTAYTLTLIAMMFTALSYGKMVRVYSSAGSSYSYALKTLGPQIGFMVGWLSLLDYLLLPMINVLLAQQYLSVIFPDFASWIWILLITLVITIVNIRGIESTAQINSFFVYFQIAIVIAFICLCVRQLLNAGSASSVISLEPFYNNNFAFSSIVSGATVLCFSFLGFDAVSNYVEEAKNPKRDVAWAIMLTAVIGGGIFIITSYFTQLVFPDITLFKDIENSTAADISYHIGGNTFQIVFLLASFAGVFASGLASHASVSRLLYVMGRDNVLPPRIFAHISPRFFTPVYNIAFVGIVCLTSFFFTLEDAIYSISFGSLIAFSFVNISVIAHYVQNKQRKNTLKEILFNIIMPLIGFAVIIVLWLNIKGPALLLGLVWGMIGLLYWLCFKKLLKIERISVLMRWIKLSR